MSSDDPEDHAANDSEFEQLGIRNCQPLPEGMPGPWYDHQLRVSVGLIFTGNNCVSKWFFKTFEVTSIQDAIRNIIKADDINLQYTFSTDTTVPLYAYDADWLLFPNGRQLRKCVPRSPVQDIEPWNDCWDKTVFEIYRKPFDGDPLVRSLRWGGRVYLRVGGRTPEQAAQCWGQCAKVVRSIYRRVRSGA